MYDNVGAGYQCFDVFNASFSCLLPSCFNESHSMILVTMLTGIEPFSLNLETLTL